MVGSCADGRMKERRLPKLAQSQIMMGFSVQFLYCCRFFFAKDQIHVFRCEHYWARMYGSVMQMHMQMQNQARRKGYCLSSQGWQIGSKNVKKIDD